MAKVRAEVCRNCKASASHAHGMTLGACMLHHTCEHLSPALRLTQGTSHCIKLTPSSAHAKVNLHAKSRAQHGIEEEMVVVEHAR